VRARGPSPPAASRHCRCGRRIVHAAAPIAPATPFTTTTPRPQVLKYLDQTQAFSTWVVLDCVFGKQSDALRPSIVRTVVTLAMPVLASLFFVLLWGLSAALRPLLQRWIYSEKRGLHHYQPRILMTTGVVLFYFYPQVGRGGGGGAGGRS
jgi:hypothetical protein